MSAPAAEPAVEEGARPVRPGPRVFSGHESFACRYGWLPKLYDAAVDDPALFASDDDAMLRLGLGRNMLKSLRFWGDAFGLTKTRGGKVTVTDFARRLLDPTDGFDPYLETPGALWRLHWRLTVHAGLGAWAVAFLETFDREITRERFVAAVRRRASQARGTITSGTATNHVDVFLRTYAGSEYSDGAPEETLGSPFQELELLRTAAPAGDTDRPVPARPQADPRHQGAGVRARGLLARHRARKRNAVAQVAHVVARGPRRRPPAGRTRPLRQDRGAVLPLPSSRAAERRRRRLRPDEHERPAA